MTTIANKSGVIAYDSRTTNGNTITSNSKNKHVKRGGVHFFMCGSVADHEGFVQAYLSGKPPNKHVDILAYIVKDGVVYRAGADKGELWIHKAHAVDSIGSGQAFAWGAMDAGCSAKEAVRIAAGRDTGTGGRIRTFRIKGDK